jgi:hypothetical protein
VVAIRCDIRLAHNVSHLVGDIKPVEVQFVKRPSLCRIVSKPVNEKRLEIAGQCDCNEQRTNIQLQRRRVAAPAEPVVRWCLALPAGRDAPISHSPSPAGCDR